MELFPEAIVLVAVVRSPRDWRWIQEARAYRIPLRHAPPLAPFVDFVAFYYTAAFGAERWSIRHYAPLRGYELVRRRDLFPEEPDHPRAEALYYLLQLGPIQSLPRPVASRRWHRFTFLLTTGERLLQASDLAELPLEGIERQLLRGALREEILAFISQTGGKGKHPMRCRAPSAPDIASTPPEGRQAKAPGESHHTFNR